MKITDKALREMMRDCREDTLLTELAAEVLRLRPIARAAEAFVINAQTRHAQTRWDALVKALGLGMRVEKALRARGGK